MIWRIGLLLRLRGTNVEDTDLRESLTLLCIIWSYIEYNVTNKYFYLTELIKLCWNGCSCETELIVNLIEVKSQTEWYMKEIYGYAI